MNHLSIYLLSISLVLFSVCSVASAQTNEQSLSLLSKKAANSVEKKFAGQQGRVLRGVSKSLDYSVASAFRVETAESVLLRNERTSGIYANYKAAAYLSYVRGVVDVGELLEYEEEDAAKKVLLLEGLRFSNEYIAQPLLGDFYTLVISELRAIRDKTTLSLVQSSKGDIDFSHGGQPPKALLQFRIHASAHNGLEPRVTFSDSLKLRLQPLEKKVLLEFSFTF